MGVDIRLTLPGDVRVKDAAQVMGVLAGLPVEQVAIGSSPAIFVEVRGISIEGTMFPETAKISLDGPMVDGAINHFVHWYFEGDRGFERVCLPPSTAFWIAIARGLIDFFGGKVDYQDCYESEVDYEGPAYPFRESNCPTDGELWDVFQKRILDLVPLTAEDLNAVRSFAAYKHR